MGTGQSGRLVAKNRVAPGHGAVWRTDSQLASANDKNNFLALVLEVNFAHQFESHGIQLIYEVKQDPGKPSTVDFLRTTAGGKRVYLELRLLQEAKSIATLCLLRIRRQ